MLPAWTRSRRPAARVCTLPIDKALQLSAADGFAPFEPSEGSVRRSHASPSHEPTRTTEKPDRRVPGGLRIGAFLGPIPSSTGARAASYATTEKPRRL